MKRIDSHILKQLFALFGVATLILAFIFWVNAVLPLFDLVVSNRQNMLVFIEFSILILPNIIYLIVPFAVIFATFFVINRLISDSEVNVLRATRNSTWRLSRPFWFFSALIAVIMLFLAHFIIPHSNDRFARKQVAVAENFTAQLLTDGVFQYPSDGVTFYIQSISENGELNNIFLNDSSSKKIDITYSASRAFLLRTDDGPKLVLINGVIQRLDKSNNNLSITKFNDYAVNLYDFIATEIYTRYALQNLSTVNMLRLYFGDGQILTGNDVIKELVTRTTQSFIVIAIVMICFSTLLTGQYSRFGVWKHIAIAICVLIGLSVFETYMAGLFTTRPQLWPLMSLPFAAGSLYTLLLILRTDTPWRSAAAVPQ